MHYRVIDTVQEAMEAAAKLAEFHSISVMWEGFDVNRNGKLTWIICGYLLVLLQILQFTRDISTLIVIGDFLEILYFLN